MNENNETKNPLANSEEHEKLISEYEAKIALEKADKEKWKNSYLKSEQTRLELTKQKERTEEERDDWKRQAFANRKIELEKKETQAKNEALHIFTQKLENRLQGGLK